jgi:hypothetical protein
MGKKVKLRMMVETIFEVDMDWYDDTSIDGILKVEKSNLFNSDQSFIDIITDETSENEFTLEAL